MSEKLEAYYGLPEEVKFCTNCVISNQRPSSTVEFKNKVGEKNKKDDILVIMYKINYIIYYIQ